MTGSESEWRRACKIRPEDGPLLREMKEILAEPFAGLGAEIIEFPRRRTNPPPPGGRGDGGCLSRMCGMDRGQPDQTRDSVLTVPVLLPPGTKSFKVTGISIPYPTGIFGPVRYPKIRKVAPRTEHG